MKKESSCVAVFIEITDAQSAIQNLLTTHVNEDCISLVGETIQQGKVAADGLSFLDNDLLQLGIHKANLYCYKSLVYSGAYLVIVNGDYKEVEHAYSQLEQYEQADVAIHFNAK
ncbi:MAG: hypothetical protein COA63_007735 [Methylophaga sp.]|nr:hypothetical protein [Methylophaga sp.]